MMGRLLRTTWVRPSFTFYNDGVLYGGYIAVTGSAGWLLLAEEWSYEDGTKTFRFVKADDLPLVNLDGTLAP